MCSRSNLTALIAALLLIATAPRALTQTLDEVKRLEQAIEKASVPPAQAGHARQQNTSGVARKLFAIYQRQLTKHLATQCPYHPSCSEFGRQCFEEYGSFKAFTLSFDRLTRCNKVVLNTGAMKRHLLENNRLQDPVSDYR